METAIERLTNPEIGYYLRKIGLRKSLIKNSIDVVLAEYGPTGTMVMKDCEKLRSHWLFIFTVEMHTIIIQSKTTDHVIKEMFAIASKIIVVSHDMKNQVMKLGAPESKINVTPCGPNQSFDINVDIVKNPNQFISTGRFVGKKAPHLVIKAFNRLLQSEENCKLIMLADGPLLRKCKALVKELSIENKVEFLGPQNKEVILDLFKKSFAFIQHSIRADDGDSEGTPVSILEAMLAGLPIISTRHAGIKDVVDENGSGYLVDEGDWQTMALNMNKLIDDRIEAQKMGHHGKQRVKKYFTLDHHLKTVWETIQSSRS